jgi:hypothetical protein
MNKRTTVVDIRHHSYDIYCGRPGRGVASIWGNPFREGIDGNRKQVIDKYKDYLLNSRDLFSQLDSLRGKRLGCFCAGKGVLTSQDRPWRCHCQVLAYYADQLEEEASP